MFKNKPWKAWKTRKFSFVYCVGFGTAAIVFGATMIASNNFDTATWLTETLDFCKFIIGTGTALVLMPSVKDFVKLVVSMFNGNSEMFTNTDINE